MNESSNILSTEVKSAVNLIRTAILQSQERAVKAVNQEQLALYYGIGRFISANTRNKNWGKGVIESISNQLRQELPGLRGFGVSSLKNMRVFYEAWSDLETNSTIAIAKIDDNSPIAIGELQEATEIKADTIRQLQLANLKCFPSSFARIWTKSMSTTSCRTIFNPWALPPTRQLTRWNQKS